MRHIRADEKPPLIEKRKIVVGDDTAHSYCYGYTAKDQNKNLAGRHGSADMGICW